MLDSKRNELGSTLVGRTLLIVTAVDSVRSRMRKSTYETIYYISGHTMEWDDCDECDGARRPYAVNATI